MAARRVLVVGSGLTGAAVACRLARLPIQVTSWDKADRIGGRMATHRKGKVQVDLGPQFFTRQAEDRDYLFEELVESGLIRSLARNMDNRSTDIVQDQVLGGPYADAGSNEAKAVDDNLWREEDGTFVLCKPDNYQAVTGTQSIVECLWTRSGVNPELNHFLHKIEDIGSQWKAVNETHGREEFFDAIILTLPVPQYIGTSSSVGRPLGNYLERIADNQEVYESMSKVDYCTTFSVGVLYKAEISLDFSWQHRYFPDNNVIRYISVDSSRRRGKPGDPTSISVQTHRHWSQHNIHLTKDEAKSVVFEELLKLIPSLAQPDYLIGHKWRYSQTETPYPSSPGAVKLVNTPLLIGAGDSFTTSNAAGCLYSAKVAASILESHFCMS